MLFRAVTNVAALYSVNNKINAGLCLARHLFCYFITIRLISDQGLNTFVRFSLVRFHAWSAM